MTLGGVLFAVVVLCEFLPIVRRNASWKTRIGFYFCGAIIYYISVSGVASVDMESMLRYEFCLHALIVLAFVHFWRQLRSPTAGPCIRHGGYYSSVRPGSACRVGMSGILLGATG
jgi:hypothetical protein